MHRITKNTEIEKYQASSPQYPMAKFQIIHFCKLSISQRSDFYTIVNLIPYHKLFTNDMH